MELGNIPHGLRIIAVSYMILCLMCFLYILWDQRRRPAPMMPIMLWVWPINALWAGPFGVWVYRVIGVGHSAHTLADMDMNSMHHAMPGMKMPDMKMPGTEMPNMKMADADMSGMKMPATPQQPGWKSVTASTLHCGAGCTLADLVGPWLFRLMPFALFGSAVYGEWALDYGLALMTGVIFQHAGLAAMSSERGPKLWWRAFRVDFLSLSSWQVGMYGWMGLMIFGVFGSLSPQDPVFWFMMQISMACGFVTAWPMNWLLIRTGIKSGM